MVGSTSYPVSVSSLEFPTLSLSFSQTLATLRRSALSITNRLLSIEADSIFVQEVAQHYGLPLVANERCGSWYIPPEKKSGSAYFKSTDGHAGQWDFSPRRLNLQLLSIAREHGGYDKNMPPRPPHLENDVFFFFDTNIFFTWQVCRCRFH